MDTIHNGYRGLSLLVDLNWDRFFAAGTVFAALSAGLIIGSVFAG